MGRLKGQRKTGGRKPGVPNKNTAELREIVREKLGRDGLEELCDRYLYHKEAKNEANADKMITEIVSYTTPKLKAIEHSTKDGEDSGIIISVQRVDLDERKKQLKGK